MKSAASHRLRIAMAALNPTVGDLAGNSAEIARAVAAASSEGVHLIVFPEMALTGYPIEDLALWAKNKGANLKILRKLNPWLIGNSLTIQPLNYTIVLPIPSYNLKNYLDYKK